MFVMQAGIDVNVPNSYEQTALDIVNKFTRKAGAKELKTILQGIIYCSDIFSFHIVSYLLIIVVMAESRQLPLNYIYMC